MALSAHELALLTDARLTSDARVIGLYLLSKGDGVHEVARVEFGDVLSNAAGKDRVQRAVAQLERFEWVKRTPGGRGHSDRFEIKVPDCTAPKPLSSRIARHLKPLVVEDDDEVLPPIVPLRALDPKADQVIQDHGDKLAGCRGSMTDYLIARVPASRQYAFVQTVVGWMGDIDPAVWRLPAGGWLDPPERTKVLAAAFNDLAASDEATMKRPVGDVANLRTKINVLLRKRGDHGNGNGNGGGAAATQRRATGTSDQSTRRTKPLGYEE